MADLGNIGKFMWVRDPQYGGNAFTLIRSGGLVVVIPSTPANAIVNLTLGGTQVDRRKESGGTTEFYDLQPGNFIAASVFGGGTGTTWSVIVTPTTYTVTRITSATIPSVITQG